MRAEFENWYTKLQLIINGITIGDAFCSGDTRGRRGNQNPDWWPNVVTQYGVLQRWSVTEKGSFLNANRISDVSIEELALRKKPYITAGIHVPYDTKACGINLFGEEMGDYHQGINMMISYQ